ncbi:hypothetical protein [uncultured Nitratireductor sp.]|uniref:hypothetical protein n=1 Tax=uncultured Nitratireductor sp. TaxID=520953 RepID=UPI0025D8D675|nr:hypothetical protein [uncultured Nitratireductor sp.]
MNEVLERQLVELRATLSTIADFYARPSLNTMQRSLTAKRPIYAGGFVLTRFLMQFAIGRMALIVASIFFHGRRSLPGDDRITFQFSLTANNTAALERANLLINAAYGLTEAVNDRKMPIHQYLRSALSLPTILAYARELKPYRDRAPLTCVFLALSAAADLLMRRALAAAPRKHVLVANDHSPATVALLNIARGQGLKTAYLQHGQVTDDFPPLVCDLSVLHNECSLQAYRRAAQKRGVPFPDRDAILMLPSFSDNFRMPRVGPEPDHICVYLSNFPSVDALTRLVATLAQQAWVKRISLRRHPRCKTDLNRLLSAGEGKCEILDRRSAATLRPHIGIVSNSGVVIEALHRGVPLLYFAEGDTIPYDYYGYAEDKIVPIYTEENLKAPQTLNAFYSDAWRARFSMYDPTVEKELHDVQASFVMGIGGFLGRQPTREASGIQSG